MPVLGKTTKTGRNYPPVYIGERVRVKSLEEIIKITDYRNVCIYKWAGEEYRLTFMPTMKKFCGKEFTVKYVSEEDGTFTLCGAETCISNGKNSTVNWFFCLDMVEII